MIICVDLAVYASCKPNIARKTNYLTVLDENKYPPAIFLMGPTASGKTAAAIAAFEALPVELISVDSALVFEAMDIGTAKPDAQTLARAPHHLIDIVKPTEAYSAANFRQDALKLMKDIAARGKVPLLVGGTMLYFKALESGLSGLPEANADVRADIDREAAALGWPAMHEKLTQIDPQTAARIKPNDMQRIQRALEVYALTGKTMSALYAAQQSEKLPYRLCKLALVPSERKVLHQRIEVRFNAMLKAGLVEEVKALLKRYPELTADATSMRCVGYRQVLSYLNGEYDLNECENRGIYATRQLAKRQLTWLRGMQDLIEIDCLEENYIAQVLTQIRRVVASHAEINGLS